jgi:DNA (cytosine-5)-methyltransferase 1
MAVEKDVEAARVYQDNWDIECLGDVTEIDWDQAAVKLESVDVLTAGFPCQPFSKGGAQRGVEETRGTLFFNVLEAIAGLKPKVVFLENVRNLAGPKHKDTWATIIASLRELGYQVSSDPFIVSPSWLGPAHGTPQNRERVFILATRVGVEAAGDEPGRTVELTRWPGTWDLAADLPLDGLAPELLPGETVELGELEETWLNAWDDFVQTARREGAQLLGVTWADAWELEEVEAGWPSWKKRFVELNRAWYLEQKTWVDAWSARWDVSSFPASRRKLEWQAQDAASFEECLVQMRPSGLRVKKATHTGALVAIDQRPIIGALRRRLTARECARLQGFPEEFTFRSVGPKAAYKQAGNAVCVPAIRWAFEEHVRLTGAL